MSAPFPRPKWKETEIMVIVSKNLSPSFLSNSTGSKIGKTYKNKCGKSVDGHPNWIGGTADVGYSRGGH